MRSELTLRVPTGLGVRREGLGEEREEGDGVHLEGTADEIEWKAWEMDVESWRGIGRGGLLSFSVERVPSEPLSASRNAQVDQSSGGSYCHCLPSENLMDHGSEDTLAFK
jgi:hypothetical protein